MAFYIAFYKRNGNLMHKFIRFWDHGKYSHCELVFSNGFSASASFKDGREVRKKLIVHSPESWDFIELPAHLEQAAWEYFLATEGEPYDLFGQVRFLISPITGMRRGHWCSEWCAKALGSNEAWRYTPNGLYDALRMLVESTKQR